MGQKQIAKKTQITKMQGMDAINFLHSRAGCVTRSFGDRAGLKIFGFHLVNLPLSSVASALHRHLCEREYVFIFMGTSVARVGLICFRSKLEILLAIRLVVLHMICTPSDHNV